MSPERLQQVASLGGKKAHALGLAHRFTAEEAREAGQKGRRNRKNKRLKKNEQEN